MKPNMIKKWSIALLVAAGAAGLTGCDGLRVDEGASESDHSGIVADRTITGKLSGIVVDEYGQSLEGVSVSAYGVSTETDAGGTWTLENVPITNLVIANVFDNGTNTDVATDADSDGQSPVVANGKIYTSFSKTGYSTFHSTYEGAIAVITHSGDESGANSIVVDGISATIPYVELAQMNRTFEGMVYDLGESSPNFLTGLDSDASGVQLRLVPSYVDDDLYGFDGDTGDDLTSEEFSPGYYGLDPLNITLTGGAFKIENGGALRDGYELRVDGTEYKPAGYPIWNTGVTQNLIPVYLDNNTLLTDAFPGGTDAGQTAGYWKINKLNIATGTNSLTTKFGDLFVVDYDSDAGDLLVSSISYHNGPYNMTAASGAHDNDTIFIDSDLTAIDSSNAIIVVFDEDIRSINKPELAAKLYNDELVLIDTTVTISGRTLSIAPTAALEKGGYRLILKRDSFIGKDGGRLGAADPDQVGWDLSDTDSQYDSAFYLVYGTSEYLIGTTDNLTQDADDTYVNAAGASTPDTSENVRMFVKKSASTSVEEIRVERLQDALYWVLDGDDNGAPNLNTTNGVWGNALTLAATNVDTDNASVSFEVKGGTTYRVTVTDGKGTEYALSSTFDINNDGSIQLITAAADNATKSSGVSNTDNFTVQATTDGRATLFVAGVQVGHTVAVTPLGELGTTNDNRTDGTPGGTLSLVLKDQVPPRVAVQFASSNGQDNGSFVVYNLRSTDDTGEVLYDGKTRLAYPKLNLTSSLYDRSGYRSRTEPADNETNVTGDTPLADDLVTKSLESPLLAIDEGDGAFATTTAVGETYSGRSDAYYTKTDYDNWYYTGISTSSTTACNYYMAEISNVTSSFTGNWFPSDSAGTVTAGGVAVVDQDLVMSSINTTGDLAGYTKSGTYTSGGLTGDIIEGPAGCTPVATSSSALTGPEADRTIVIETTEEIGSTFTFDKTTSGATLEDEDGVYAARTNIQSGTNLDNDTTGIKALTHDEGHAHLLATIGDWRTITDTPRWDSRSQNDVANTVGEGASVKSLMQVVGLVDTAADANMSDAADHAVGVVFADATPPMAYDASVSENSFTITFDQAVRENNGDSDNFTVYGAYDNFTFEADGSPAKYYVYRHGTTYVDPYGTTVGTGVGNRVEVSVTSASYAFTGGELTGEKLTYTLADNATHDFSGYFAGLASSSADTTDDNATGTGTPSFYVEYDFIQDLNFNSWDGQDASDQYDNNSGPRLIGNDTHRPKLLTDVAANVTDNSSYLYYVSSPGISLSSAHVTVFNDNDTEFTMGTSGGYLLARNSVAGAYAFATDNNTSGYASIVTGAGAIGAVEAADDEDDYPLYFVWNKAAGYERIPDNVTNYNRVVLDFDEDVTAVNGARVYYYKPTRDNVTTDSGIFLPDGTIEAGASYIGGRNDNQSVAYSTELTGGNLVFEFPDVDDGTSMYNDNLTVSTHQIVVDNVTINGVEWVLMINPPSSTSDLRLFNDGGFPSTFDAVTSLPTVDFYRKVYLPTAGGDPMRVGTSIAATVDNASTVTFVEPLIAASTTATFTSSGNNYNDNGTNNNTALFDGTGIASADAATPSGGSTAVTIDFDKAIGETADATFVGHGFTYTLTATGVDSSQNTSTTTFVLRRGHGTALDDGTAGRTAVLNIISGTSLAD